MDLLRIILEHIIGNKAGSMVSTSVLAAVLLVVLVLSAYEFLVYRLVSHRAFYNKSFNISLTVLLFLYRQLSYVYSPMLLLRWERLGHLPLFDLELQSKIR